MTKKQIFLNIFLALFGVFILYLSGIRGLLEFIFALIIYSLIFYIFYYIWKKIRKKEIKIYEVYLPSFLEKISGSIFLLVLILGGFSYYNNEISPSKMPIYYLSNGEKEIIFHGMSHIGTQSFYDNIKESITKNKKDGYVLFFEGVRPGTKKNEEKFDKAIGIDFNENLYADFSKLYGLANQRNEDFLFLVNNLDFNIDLSIDEIIEHYEKVNSISNKKVTKEKEPVDIGSEVVKMLSGLNERELKVLVYINQGIMNFIIKSDSFRNLVTENIGNQNLFDVILDKRNEVLSDAIISSEYKKIIIIYGLMHFDGVLKLLKEEESTWYIKKVEYLYPI